MSKKLQPINKKAGVPKTNKPTPNIDWNIDNIKIKINSKVSI